MIGFVQYLTEGRDAPLYHGTSIENLKKILRSDTMLGVLDTKPTSNHVNKNAIYLTRNYRHSGFMADVKSYETNSEDVVIELDQSKLITRYKIKPNHSSKKPKFQSPEFGGNDESEEVILAKEIKNITKYIMALHINNRVRKDAGLMTLIGELGIPVHFYKNVRDKTTKVEV